MMRSVCKAVTVGGQRISIQGSHYVAVVERPKDKVADNAITSTGWKIEQARVQDSGEKHIAQRVKYGRQGGTQSNVLGGRYYST